MISERLTYFIENWCDVDTEPEEVAKMLGSARGAFYSGWLEGELLAAARAGELTPKSLGRMTSRWFAAQPDVDAWLRQVWPIWFGRPYPG
ncbi:MAG: hypothetical protein ACRDPY_30290 [Streptosporangiaceae bacterium]